MKKVLTWIVMLAIVMAVPLSAGAECLHKWKVIGGEAATCSGDGYDVKECQYCGELKLVTVKATGKHNWYDQYELETPTCTSEGSMRTACRDCGILSNRILPATDHVWKKISGYEATCMEDGKVTRECVWCGKVTTSVIKATGKHNWYDVQELEIATCTQEGSMRTKCRDCGILSSRVIKKGSHTYSWQITVEATANSKGIRTGTCTYCGAKTTEEFYPEGTLYRGIEAKSAVKLMQEKLIACGYLNDKADGIFGKKTEQAVKDLQTASSVNADGIAWPETLQLLDTAYARLNNPTPEIQPEMGGDDTGIEYTTEDIMVGGGVIANGSVNLRSGPSLDHAIIGTVDKDTALGRVFASAVDDRGVVWLMVEYKGAECWVSTVYTDLYIGNIDYSMDRLPFPESELYPSEYYLLEGGMELMNYYMCSFDIVCSALYLDDPHEDDTGMRYTSNWALTVNGHEYTEYITLTDGSYTVCGAALGMNIAEVKALYETAGLYCSKEDGAEEIKEYSFLRPYQPDSLHVDENGFDVEILVQTDLEGVVHTLFIRTLGMEEN